MTKKASTWRRSFLIVTLISWSVVLLSFYVQENYGVEIIWWVFWPLALAFVGTMSMTLITGGQAKVQESLFTDTPFHSYDKLVGKFMVIGGVLAIFMMLLGMCTMCQTTFQ